MRGLQGRKAVWMLGAVAVLVALLNPVWGDDKGGVTKDIAILKKELGEEEMQARFFEEAIKSAINNCPAPGEISGDILETEKCVTRHLQSWLAKNSQKLKNLKDEEDLKQDDKRMESKIRAWKSIQDAKNLNIPNPTLDQALDQAIDACRNSLGIRGENMSDEQLARMEKCLVRRLKGKKLSLDNDPDMERMKSKVEAWNKIQEDKKSEKPFTGHAGSAGFLTHSDYPLYNP